jgi:hypothetical protein
MSATKRAGLGGWTARVAPSGGLVDTSRPPPKPNPRPRIWTDEALREEALRRQQRRERGLPLTDPSKPKRDKA